MLQLTPLVLHFPCGSPNWLRYEPLPRALLPSRCNRARACAVRQERAAALRKWYQLMIDNGEELAALMTEECGKPLTESRGELAYGACPRRLTPAVAALL